ncbi:RNA recognition motif-containing protein [Prochlorococcus sp. MIT 1341]|uniref:RNA recognition motif-containing protein n=1 Tax=Prochlorococcus sp. MIT 1341 TaxID=3096221 RepID=UPI002A75B4BC|nr:RNA recognition motif-containing protein [Prochlorococcus sp. MIT 1341]
MTLTNTQPPEVLHKGVREAIVDQLRACKTKEQVLSFEERFNCETNAGPLYSWICDFLHDRTISPALGAKWLRTILEDRENQLQSSAKHGARKY